MSGCANNKIERRVMKISTVSGEKPSIPPSDNHKDGSWSQTDIYKGELFWNVADGVMWTRSENGIVTPQGFTDFYYAVLNQSAANNPVDYNSITSIGEPTLTRTGKGQFTLVASGKFPENRTIITHSNVGSISKEIRIARVDDDTIAIATYLSGSLEDDVMVEMGLRIEILPEEYAS